MIADHGIQTWPVYPSPGPSQQEVDDLKKRVADLEELLRKAKIYDILNEQPNCELGDKKKTLQQLADTWGIEIHLP